MRITTRMAVGFGLLAALMAGTVVWQMSTVRSLQIATEELAETNLDAARASIRLLQALEGAREFSAKAVLLRDEGYHGQWTAWDDAAQREITHLSTLGLDGAPASELTRMEAAWDAYREEAAALRQASMAAVTQDLPGGALPSDNPEALDRVDARLDGLGDRTNDLVTLLQADVEARTRRAREAAARAGTVSTWAAGGGIILALLTWAILWLSISPPLRRLTMGTRELSRGHFDHRIPESGRSELSELARDFNRMAERLGELDELKDDFVSHVSHELKSPLAAIQETIRALDDEVAGPLTARQRRLLGHARTSTGRLGTMIGNLLTASRLEADGEHWDPVEHDVARIVRQVMAETEPVASEREVRVELRVRTEETTALCDGPGLRDVVTNLVTNALSFTPPGTRVQLLLTDTPTPPSGLPPSEGTSVGEEDGPFLLLEVTDEGPGVPEEHREAIFEKFHQVQGPNRRMDGQGVGLGLAISRRVVRAHGGAIWVESHTGPEPSEGARFRLLLPRLPRRWADLAGSGGGNEG